jgi:hypothetical protein
LEAKTYSDDAKRVADEMTLHAVAGSHGFAVFRLSDGRPMDHTAYDSWSAAVKGAKWDRDNYMYLEIQPDGMTLREGQAVLDYARIVSKMGFRIPSPDWADHQAMSMPYQKRDRMKMARQLASGKPLYPEGWVASNLPSEIRTSN